MNFLGLLFFRNKKIKIIIYFMPIWKPYNASSEVPIKKISK